MMILLTNDDGIHAQGLWALCNHFGDAHHVTVVAPDRECKIVNMMRCLSAFCRVRKNIMHQKVTTWNDMSGPGVIVGKNRLKGVPAVDKHQAQGRCPLAGDNLGATHDGHNRIFNPRIFDGGSKPAEGVYPAALGIKKLGIEIFLPGLLFLGPPVVVNGKQDAAVFPAGRTQIQG